MCYFTIFKLNFVIYLQALYHPPCCQRDQHQPLKPQTTKDEKSNLNNLYSEHGL